ncbi:MAG: hypothetical protein OSJ66_07645 [Clostridia bacterium]|nr:hypothetical protein [Clostridia bacterium]
MNKSKIEDLYDNMQDKIVRDICKDSRLDNIWAEINEIDELLKNTLSKEDYDIFDDYLSKEAKLIDLERKKAFAYGYNLSNKLMIESMRE